MSAHAALRTATREAHDRVDARFSALNLADADDYRTFLSAHAAAFIPAEEALTAAGAADLVADWQAMRRGPLLLEDLAELGVTDIEHTAAPTYAGAAEVLGGIYVLEGSRLGGAVLRKAVAPGLPQRFLGQSQPSGRWRAFIAQLDRSLYQDVDQASAAAAAERTFALFETVGWDQPSE